MQRRLVDVARNYDELLEMHRLSWDINFPGRQFYDAFFKGSLISGAEHGEIYVYEEDGEIVGWLWLDLRNPTTGHVRHIQVAQSHWGQGIGRQIMEDAIRMCIEEGREALTLTVTKANVRAMALYASLGFEVAEDQGERQFMRLDLGLMHPEPSGR